MAKEKQLQQLHREGQKPVETAVYTESAYGVDGAGQCYETTETVGYIAPHLDYDKEGKAHQRKEHLGDLGNVASGAYALYEKHQAKMDEAHKQRHKIEEDIATAVSVGAGGYTFHEHHQKKEAKV